MVTYHNKSNKFVEKSKNSPKFEEKLGKETDSQDNFEEITDSHCYQRKWEDSLGRLEDSQKRLSQSQEDKKAFERNQKDWTDSQVKLQLSQKILLDSQKNRQNPTSSTTHS